MGEGNARLEIAPRKKETQDEGHRAYTLIQEETMSDGFKGYTGPEYKEIVQELDANVTEGVDYRSDYDADWDGNYKRIKGRMWEMYDRSPLRPRLDFHSALMHVIKEQSVIDQGKYKVIARPLRSDKRTFVQARLMNTFADQRWVQHDMHYKTILGLVSQAYTGVHITKTVWDPDVEDFVTLVVNPEDLLVSKGAVDFDKTCRFVVHRIPMSVKEIRIRYGKLIADMAPPIAAAISRGNGGGAYHGIGVGIMPDGRVDFFRDTGAADDRDMAYLDEHLVRDGPKKIRKIVKIDDTILSDDIIGIEEYWYIRWPGMAINEFWPVATSKPAGVISDAENIFVSYLIDYMRESTYMKWIVDTNSGIKIQDFDNAPGGIMWSDIPVGDAVRNIAPPPLSNSAWNFTSLLDRKMERASFPDEAYGQLSRGNRTAEQTKLMISASQTPVTLKASLLGRSAGKWAMLNWNLEVALATKVQGVVDSPSERIINLTGADATNDPRELEENNAALSAAVIKGPDVAVTYDFVAGLPQTREARKQESLVLHRAKAIDNTALLKDFEREDAQEISQRIAQQMAQATAMKQQGPPTPQAAGIS
jgi:hypothetical protein